MKYDFKTKPFDHQLRVWKESRDLEEFAIFWEQGTGKSKLTVDTCGWLYTKGDIDGMLVVAPNGIHRNWTDTEIPTHLPDHIFANTHMLCYDSVKARTKYFTEQQREFMDKPVVGYLSIATISYDALITKHGKKFVRDFLNKRRTLMVLDESARIKNPSANRTRACILIGKHANFKRILTGTPVANSPFDLFSQMQFLNSQFWNKYNVGAWSVFKTFFGIWERKYNSQTGREYDQLIKHKNLDILAKAVGENSSRVTKDEVLDLPPKLYSRMTFKLTAKQRRAYEKIRDEFLLFLEDGDMVSAPLIITRLMRLQQITSGYLVSDLDEFVLIDEVKDNPRLSLLRELCEDAATQTIIWAKFTSDIDLICEMLTKLKLSHVRYDGGVKNDDRAKAIKQFQDGDAQFFVANPAAAGEGLTLHAAKTVIYYNNSFKLTERLQSEDRAHRIGQEHPVQYIDIVAPGTVDVRIVNALRDKLDISNTITGDKVKEWL